MKRDDKTGIIYREWKTSSPEAVLLLIHGLGAHSGRWDFLADFFVKKGFSSYAIELKGFGETKDLKGHIDSFDIYLKDILSLYEIITEENKGKKIFLISESMGALISLLTAHGIKDVFSGIICISPAFKSRLKFSALDYMKIISALCCDSRKQFKVPFNSRMCTRDIAYQKVMDAEPREHRFATPKLLFNLLVAQVRFKMLPYKLAVPILFLIAGKYDELVDPKESKRIFNKLKAKDKELLQYTDMRHALSIELGRESVFEDILKWIEKRL